MHYYLLKDLVYAYNRLSYYIENVSFDRDLAMCIGTFK